MIKILYFKTKESTFILKDQQILQGNFDTGTFRINTSTTFKYVLSIIKVTLYLAFFSWKYDVFFIRFADWHTAILAFFKKLYNKKLFIVIGGYDVAAIQEINYGAHINKRRSKFINYSLRNATWLLPNSKSLIYYENMFISDQIVYGGIEYFVKKTNARIQVVPNGFDSNIWKPIKDIPKRKMALTVAMVNDMKTFYLKGLDKFIQCAFSLPNYEFVIIGLNISLIEKNNIDYPQNIKIMGPQLPHQLLRYYSEAKLFCLFSLSEGMPNVLCEAMLCECIPVGTNVTSIPEIIENTGFIIKERNLSAYLIEVNKAFEAEKSLQILARKRIMEYFSFEKREKKLVEIIKSSF